jgi:hypothetical protein
MPSGLRISPDNAQLSFWILITIVAYILGHVLSSLSKWLFELIIANKLLAPPYVNLFAERKSRIMNVLFPEYFVAFPERIRQEILRSEHIDFHKPKSEQPRALYDEAYALVKTDKDSLSRLDTFLILYGFCRTISMTLLILAAALAIKGSILVGTVSFIISLIMFMRYLKFFRQYSYELFLSSLRLRKA